MEKRGVVKPGVTPDVDEKLPREKVASGAGRKQQTQQLDDDLTKRAADKAAEKLRRS